MRWRYNTCCFQRYKIGINFLEDNKQKVVYNKQFCFNYTNRTIDINGPIYKNNIEEEMINRERTTLESTCASFIIIVTNKLAWNCSLLRKIDIQFYILNEPFDSDRVSDFMFRFVVLVVVLHDVCLDELEWNGICFCQKYSSWKKKKKKL